MDKTQFAKGVERLVNPIEVGSIHVVQQLNRFLPKFIQNKLMESSGKNFPQMGFVVEPYSFFLFHKIKNLKKVQELLPDGFRLIKTKVFENDTPDYYVIFGCFRAHTSAFWGSRIEFYVVAEDENTGLLSWMMIDYDSNTIGYDKQNGLKSPNCKEAVITINHRGRVVVDFRRDDLSRDLVFDSSIVETEFEPLDQRLWLEGNLSVGYGKDLKGDSDDIFSLKFEPCEVEKALRIPAGNVNIEKNTWFPGLFEEKTSIALCFPYAQHFISDSPGFSSQLKNKDELKSVIENINFKEIEVFNTDAIKLMFVMGFILSTLTTITLLILLVLK